MEYLVGAIGGVALVVLIILLLRRESVHTISPLTMSESTIISLVHQVASMYEDDDEEEDEDDGTKVVFANNKAYWLDEGKFFVADTDGESVLVYTKREVDTMAMNHVELSQLIKIVEALRSDDEDRS